MDEVFVMTGRPDSSEAAEYYFTYIDQVADGDICAILGAGHVTHHAKILRERYL